MDRRQAARARTRMVPAAVAVLSLAACATDAPPTDGAADTPPTAGVTSPVGSPEPQSVVRVVAVGDIACKPGAPVTPTTCQQAATASLAEALDPDVVLTLGDLQYEIGAADDFAQGFDQSWGALSTPIKPLPGNHEYRTSDAGGYISRFDVTQPTYYAWDAGSWRVYMLDSNCEEIDCSAQREWLVQDLKANPRDCSAIAMHHPRFSSGAHGPDKTMNQFWSAAYAAGVDVALAAHDHHYERFGPLDVDGDPAPGRGITSFVSGTGGKSLYLKERDLPGSAFFQNTRFGVLELTLAEDRFAWEYHAVDGSVLDSGQAQCV